MASLLHLIRERASASPNGVAMRYKHRGLWHDVTWRRCQERVEILKFALGEAGVRAGDVVAVVADATPEWALTIVAISEMGATPMSIYKELGTALTADVLRENPVQGVVFDQRSWLRRLSASGVALPSLLFGLGSATEARGASSDALERPVTSPPPESPEPGPSPARDSGTFAFVTAGTDEAPKVVVHSTASLIASGAALLDALTQAGGIGPGDRYVLELPTGHLLALVLTLVVPLLAGAVVHVPESGDSRTLEEVRPTIAFNHNRTWEARMALLQSAAFGASRAKRRLLRGASIDGRAPVGAESERRHRRRSVLARLLVVWPILRRLGLDRLRAALVIGPLSPDVMTFWIANGVPLDRVYCTTETGVIGLMGGGDLRALSSAELRFDSAGQILARAPSMAVAYVAGQDQTVPVTDESGWFATGDRGVPSKRSIRWVGRMREVIAEDRPVQTSLTAVEASLRASPAVRAAVARVADDGSIRASIDLNMPFVTRWATAHGITYRSPDALRADDRVVAAIRDELGAIRHALAERGLPPVEDVSILPRGLTLGIELTPMWTVRRRMVGSTQEILRQETGATETGIVV